MEVIKKVNLSITVFASMSLLLIVSLLFSLTEMCRMRVSKLYMQVACNAAIDSLFSQYHRNLWDMYRIFGLENFEDDLLIDEYMDFLKPHIKDDDMEYLANYYIGDIDYQDITFENKYLIENTYFEEEILDYMKYGMVDSIINFAGIYFDFNGNYDQAKVDMLNTINEVARLQKNNELYEEFYKKYFDFKNEVTKLEKYSLQCINYVNNYNNYIKNFTFSTVSSKTTINNNFTRLENMEKTLSGLQKYLEMYFDVMEGLEGKVLENKDKYEIDKKNIEDLDEDIDKFVEDEFQYFLDYTSDTNPSKVSMYKEIEEVESLYPIINEYKGICQSLKEQLQKLEEEKSQINELYTDSESRRDARNEINEQINDLYDEARDIGLELKDGTDSFMISNLELDVSSTNDFNKTTMFDKVLDLMNNGFLSLCLENDEIEKLKDENILYENYDIDSENKVLEKIVLSEYELNFFNFFKKEAFEKTTKSESELFEVENLICGKNNNKKNIESIILKLLTIRQGANLVYLYSNSDKRHEARELSILLFGAFSIIVQEMMFIVILNTWALCQSFVDVYNLLHEKRVPLIHTNETFSFSLENIINLNKNTIYDSNSWDDAGDGLSYEDYLRVMLVLMNQKDINSRMVSTIEYNLQLNQENASMSSFIYSMDIENIFHCKHYFTDMVFVHPNNVELKDEYEMKIKTYYDYIE